METSKFLKVGIEAAKNAGEILMSYLGKIREVRVKSNHFSNIVTLADLESENRILSILKNKFPSHSIYSEEKGESLLSSEYLWVIDPLDGTIIFVNGLEYFGISIGLLYRFQPIVGIIYLPALDELFTAQKGKGAYFNNKKMVMSKTSKLNNSIIAFDYGYGDRNKSISNTLMKTVPFLRYPLTFGSASFSLSRLANSKIQGYIHPSPTKFDIAAGSLIIKEAGGKVTDFFGSSLDWSKKETTFLASCRAIHRDLVKILKSK